MRVITDPESKAALDQADREVRQAERALSEAKQRRKALQASLIEKIYVDFR